MASEETKKPHNVCRHCMRVFHLQNDADSLAKVRARLKDHQYKRCPRRLQPRASTETVATLLLKRSFDTVPIVAHAFPDALASESTIQPPLHRNTDIEMKSSTLNLVSSLDTTTILAQARKLDFLNDFFRAWDRLAAPVRESLILLPEAVDEDTMWTRMSTSSAPSFFSLSRFRRQDGSFFSPDQASLRTIIDLIIPDDDTLLKDPRSGDELSKSRVIDSLSSERSTCHMHVYDATLEVGQQPDLALQMHTNALSIPCTTLSPRASRLREWEGQPNAVFSAKGSFTDSHCDPLGAVNFAMHGSKLWLVAEHRHASEAGFICDTCCPTAHRVNPFDFRRFLELPSQRIYVVQPSTVLYLPRGWFHRVYTLTPYAGVASSYLPLSDVGSFIKDCIDARPDERQQQLCIALCTVVKEAVVAGDSHSASVSGSFIRALGHVLLPRELGAALRRAISGLLSDLRPKDD